MQPCGELVQAIASEQDARDDRCARVQAQCRKTRLHRCAVDDRVVPRADPPFREDADHATLRKSHEGVAECIPVTTVAFHWNTVERAEDPPAPGSTEEFLHGEPVEPAGKKSADDGGVKVADMVGGHDEGPFSRNRCQLQDPDVAGQSEKKAPTPYDQPVKSPPQILPGNPSPKFGALRV